MTTTSTTTTGPTYTQELPTWLVPLLEEKVTKANRKAARAGMGEPFALTIDREWTTAREIGGVEYKDHWAAATVHGANTGLPGWEYAAKVTWDATLPVISTSPFYSGAPLPRPASRACDHCGTTRRRDETHLVTGPGGAVKQVGTSCLTAYTGIHVGWVAILEGLEVDADERLSYGRLNPLYDTDGLLEITIRIVDSLGYVSAANTGTSTSTRERFQILVDGPHGSRDRAINTETLEAMATRHHTDDEIAGEIFGLLAWAATLGSASNDYLLNLHAIFAERQVTERNLGYALSGVSAYRRHLAKEVVRVASVAAAAARTPVVEGRHPITGVIESVKAQEGDYGTTMKIRLLTDTGSMLWGTLPAAIDTATPGSRVAFTATVKASADDPTFGFYSRPSKASIL